MVNAPPNEDFWLATEPASIMVRVTRHHAARRLRLRWDPAAGELRLTVPPRHRLADARAWLAEQGAWIAQQRVMHPGGRIAIISGMTLPWNGGELVVHWSADAPRRPRCANRQLVIGGPPERLAARVGRWIAAEALADYRPRAEELATAAQLPLQQVAVGDARRRWGSCSSAGVLRFSWRLMLAPAFVRQALVAHEVAHLAHMDHGPRFRALERQLGGDDVAASRQWLRQHGAALHRYDFGG